MAQKKEATTTKAAPAKGKAATKSGSAKIKAAGKATRAKAAAPAKAAAAKTATRSTTAKAPTAATRARTSAPTQAAPVRAAAPAPVTPARKPAASKPAFSAEEALLRRAAESGSIIDFVDHTTLSGTEEDVTGELSTADQHPADTSDMTFQRELDLTVRNIAEQRRAEVEEALARQRAGTYGICAECGKPIDPERLRARPEATLCIECARQREHAGHLA